MDRVINVNQVLLKMWKLMMGEVLTKGSLIIISMGYHLGHFKTW